MSVETRQGMIAERKTSFRNRLVFLAGFLTFLFGFAIPALFNLYLISTASPLVVNFRGSLSFISSNLGDGIILPLVNMIIVFFLVANKDLIDKRKVLLGLFFGLLITLYFHTNQAALGLINWSMPKPWHWNFLGYFHALYMFFVSSLISLYFLVVIKDIRNNKKFPKSAFAAAIGIVVFLILLTLDYR